MTGTPNPLDASHLWTPYRGDTSLRRDILPYHEEYGDLLRNTARLSTRLWLFARRDRS